MLPVHLWVQRSVLNVKDLETLSDSVRIGTIVNLNFDKPPRPFYRSFVDNRLRLLGRYSEALEPPYLAKLFKVVEVISTL